MAVATRHRSRSTRSRRALRRAAVAAGLALGAAGLAPVAAIADTEVRIRDDVLEIEAGLTETNDISARKEGSLFVVREAANGPRVDAGRDCSRVSREQATCPVAGVTSVRVDLKSRGDHYDGTILALPQTVDGGLGFDRITGGHGRDTLNGGNDTDRLDGGPNDDRLNGGANGPIGEFVIEPLIQIILPGLDFGDQLDGGPGRDTLSGGPGDGDMVDYFAGIGDNPPVTVELTSGSGGLQAEPDTIFSDVEGVRGTTGSDFLAGTSGDNVLTGGVKPRDANEGNPDTLQGFGGDDLIDASANRARDTVSCGAGDDFIALDLLDAEAELRTFATCEEIEQAAIDQHPTLRILKRRSRRKGRRVRIALACPRKHRRCRGRLSIRDRRGRAVARTRRYRIKRGRRRTVKARLTRVGRRLVARRGRLRIEVIASERDPKGRPRLTLARFRLRGS